MEETQKQKEVVVGVDVGGTKIYAAVIDRQLQIIAKARRSTKAKRGLDAVVDRILQTIHDAVDEADLTMDQVQAVGVGAPGATDPEKGIVYFAPNLEWRDVPLAKTLESKLARPVIVENDCNALAYGVYRAELEGRPSSMVGIFVGTGIGAGMIINGQLYHGFNKTAGEIGHMVLQVDGPKCGCGNRGCFEALASRTAIVREIKKRLKKGEESILTELVGADIEEARSKALRKAIKRGDKVVKEVIHDAARFCGIAVANVINFLNPEVIVLGGGVIEALGEYMLPQIEKTARKYAMGEVDRGIQIIATRLGDDAGVVGCAALAWELLQKPVSRNA